MIQRDNYRIQAAQAKKLFLTYDQQELMDRCLWDENTTRYNRYETAWYAVGLLMERINMPKEK